MLVPTLPRITLALSLNLTLVIDADPPLALDVVRG